MDKNTFFAIFLSTAFLVVWFMFFQPKPAPVQPPKPDVSTALENSSTELKKTSVPDEAQGQEKDEREITVENDNYRAVFTTRGAAIKHWFLKEKSGKLIDLVYDDTISQLSTFPGSRFDVVCPDTMTVVFTHSSPLGWQVTKTYKLTAGYLHTLNIKISKTKNSAQLPSLTLQWGPGLGTPPKNRKIMSRNRGLSPFPRYPLLDSRR